MKSSRTSSYTARTRTTSTRDLLIDAPLVRASVKDVEIRRVSLIKGDTAIENHASTGSGNYMIKPLGVPTPIHRTGKCVLTHKTPCSIQLRNAVTRYKHDIPEDGVYGLQP
ncbi:hypothetical protein AcW1_010276 [Taiwanofungus camphoratus]|nr:hypothetical protein AcV7_010407 [Antrodia cinnamomea]KAI0942656.1 hypothetical protein AcW1_010276 [Antrodia cinnamomea]